MSYDQLAQSVSAFRPELALAATILVLLVFGAARRRGGSGAAGIAMLGVLASLLLAFPWDWLAESVPSGTTPIFAGALLSDSFTIVMRCLLLLFALLFVAFTQLSSDDKGVGSLFLTGDFYVLMLGALLGMCLMISANHILIVMLGVEMASVPCYVLAGMQRDRSKSSEAALKYAVFGAGAAGVMLYGLSLLAGALGSAHLPTMASRLAELMHVGAVGSQSTMLVLGGLLTMVGVAFKLSAVPFHFWAPDVFEGATAEVAAFLSVASKAAALGLLVRLAGGFSVAPESPAFDQAAAIAALAPVRSYISMLVAVLAAVTCTFGNLAAYGQTNMKRLLAYSTIAHAGYMMMPVAAAVALVGTNPQGAQSAIAALVAYITIYLFMNLAAFAIVAFLRNAIGSEEIADYAGLMRTSPGLTVCMAIVMFSLVGLPPLAGAWGKLVIILALIDAKMLTLVVIAVLNTVLSLFYYLRVVRVMVLSPEPLHRSAPAIPLGSLAGSYCASLTFMVVALFFLFGGVWDWASAAVSGLFY